MGLCIQDPRETEPCFVAELLFIDLKCVDCVVDRIDQKWRIIQDVQAAEAGSFGGIHVQSWRCL
jgi:hypothetical protein